MTPFRIEHEFRCPSVDVYWRVYFDDSHVANLDAQTGMQERTVLERREDDETLFRRIELKPKRQLPGWLRKLVKKDLSYTQTETLHKRDNRIDIEILPSIFPGRSQIKSVYTLEQAGPGRLVRAMEGTISIKVAVVGKRVEKAILEDMQKNYDVGTKITQARIDQETGAADS